MMKKLQPWTTVGFILGAILISGASIAQTFDLDVTKGFGSGRFEPGTQVAIEAYPYDDADADRRNLEPLSPSAPVRIFDRWIGDAGAIADVYAEATTLTMPASNLSISASFKDGFRWGPPALVAEIPPAHIGVLFMFHGKGGSARNIFGDEGIRRLIQQAVGRGVGVVAMDSANRFFNDWDLTVSATENVDLRRVAEARQALIDRGQLSAVAPVYVMGFSNGGVFASLFDQYNQDILGFPVQAAAIYIASGNLSVMQQTTVPTIFALAEQDDATVPALSAYSSLLAQDVPTQLWINPASPLHPHRFWDIDGMSLADSEAIHDILVQAGFLDADNYVIDDPKYSGWEPFVKEQYPDHLKPIGDELREAYGSHGFMASFNDEVLDFLLDPSTIVNLAPSLSGFEPASGLPGSEVTVYGENFVDVNSVALAGVEAQFRVLSGNQLRFTVPSNAETGLISVSNRVNTALSAADFVVNGPEILSFDPISGPPGTLITIQGEGLVNITTASIGDYPADIVAGFGLTLSIKVPVGAASGVIKVTNAVGSTQSSDPFDVTGPRIDSIEPSSAPPGTFITITGSGMVAVEEISFGGVPATTSFGSATMMQVQVPSGAGNGPVTVTNYIGTGYSPVDFTVPAPVIDAFSPTEGKAGTLIVLTGYAFGDLIGVEIGGVPAQVMYQSSTSIQAKVGAGAVTGPVVVTTRAGVAASSGNFRVWQSPTVDSFSPDTGPVGSGTVLSGNNLAETTGVSVAGVPAAFVADSDSQVRVTIPAGAGSGKIRLTTPGGTVAPPGHFVVR